VETRIRLAQPGDAPLLVAFNQALALETEALVLDMSRVTDGVQAVFESSHRGFYVVAETAGQVVGCLLVTSEWSDWRNGWFWWIQSVYVLPECRRKGVCTALHQYVEREARLRGDVCEIRLYADHENEAAHRAYEHLGMRRSRYDMYQQPLNNA
jgi:GNAT superfamily N-acetyltransferase